jgi:hypothetical protein
VNIVLPLLATSAAREPLTVTVKDALAMIGIGRTKFYAMVASGQITTVTIGRRRLVHMASLKILVSGLPAPPPPSIPVQLPLFAGEEKEDGRVSGVKRRSRRPTS